MFSLQRLLSRDDKFFDLMDGCAEEARAAIQSLITLLRSPQDKSVLTSFVEARRKEKRLTQELTEQLCKTFVTPLEREDIEAVSDALYKIPKTAEKFGERFLRAGKLAWGVDLSEHLRLLEQAADALVIMVRELRKGVVLEVVRAQNAELQRVEGEGDKLMLETLKKLYDGTHDPLQVMLMKDLLDLLEKVLDRCRDVGNMVFHIILKHA